MSHSNCNNTFVDPYQWTVFPFPLSQKYNTLHEKNIVVNTAIANIPTCIIHFYEKNIVVNSHCTSCFRRSFCLHCYGGRVRPFSTACMSSQHHRSNTHAFQLVNSTENSVARRDTFYEQKMHTQTLYQTMLILMLDVIAASMCVT